MRTIFVSSTFKDMQAERDALRDICAPKINAEARKHGDEIDFCDLRWGINTSDMSEEDSSLKVLDVCFSQIDRCQPPFIILTGYRYGWIPDKEIVSNAVSAHRFYLEDLEKSVTALEIEYGVCHLKQPTLVYIRNIRDESIPGIYDYEDEYHRNKLQELKNRILALGNTTVHEYTVHMENGAPSKNDIQIFAAGVVEDLIAVMQKDWQAYDRMTPFDRLMRTHWDYVQEKENLFTARIEDANTCLSALKSGKKQVVICAGDSGSGKSTLLSHVAMTLKNEGCHVLPISCGLTPEATDAYHITDIIMNYLCKLSSQKSADNQNLTVKDLLNRYAGILKNVPQNENIYILIDAVDQLFPDENRTRMIFIPKNIPPNVRFFITCTKDIKTDYLASLVLEDMTEQDQLRVVDGYLDHIKKELHSSVKNGILQNPSANLPLSVSLMVQRLCIMNVFDFDIINSTPGDPNQAIAERQITVISEMPSDLPSLSEYVFEEVGKRINRSFCKKLREYIAVSRFGLRAADLIKLCGGEWNTLDFAHYINYLNTDFIVRTDGRYDFMHKSLREGILKNTDIDQRNNEICSCLETLDMEDPIRQTESAYHLLKARQYGRLAEFLYHCDKIKTMPLWSKVAENFFYQIMKDGPDAVNGLIDYLYENDKRIYSCLNFLVYYLPMHFQENPEQFTMLCGILDRTYPLLREKMTVMPLKHQIMYMDRICRNFNSITIYDIELRRKYAKIKLDFFKENMDQSVPEERKSLFDAYYQAIWSLKNSDDPAILNKALAIAEESDQLLEDKTFTEYLLDQRSLYYSSYYGCLGEIYTRLKNDEKWKESYLKDLSLRERMAEKFPGPGTAWSLTGSYMNMSIYYRGSKEQDYNKALDYLTKAVKIVDSVPITETREFLEWKARLYNDYAQLKMITAGSPVSEEVMTDVVRRLIDAYSAGRKGYRKYAAAESLTDMSIIRNFVYDNKLIERFYENAEIRKMFRDHTDEWMNEDIVSLKQTPSLANYRLRYETTELKTMALIRSGSTFALDHLLYQTLDDLEPGLLKYRFKDLKEPVRLVYINLFHTTSDKDKVYERLEKNISEHEEYASFYKGMLQKFEASDRSLSKVIASLPDRIGLVLMKEDPETVKRAVREASLGLNVKEVIAYLDTTKKTLFKTVPGSVFITEKALESTYDYARHLEFKNILSAEVIKKQLTYHLKNGKSVTIDYEDPDGVIRGIIEGYHKMFKNMN